jgi:hypothetical protein
MEGGEVFSQLYMAQLDLLKQARKMHRFLDEHQMLDKEANKKFRELLKNGNSGLWKSYQALVKHYRQEARKEMLLRKS